jgi:hypothetical protein
MRRFKAELKQWSKGAMTADTTADKTPLDSATRARNVAFLKGGFPAKRKGVSVFTPAAQSGRNPILALDFNVGINWVIDSAGRWSKVNSSGVFSAIDAGAATPFTSGTHYPVHANAKNHLFVCNGVDAKKTNGTTVSNWGFAPPAAPSVSDAGAGGNMSGTYTVGLTAYNENTGHESSLSGQNSVTVAAGHKVSVTWVFPSDTQITKVRVHVFKLGLSSKFMRVGSVDVSPTPDVTTGGYSSGTLAVTLNLTDTDITNLTNVSPTTTSNNPPPANISFALFHGGRMFVTEGRYLYYSQLDDPESFDPNNFEVINTNDDQTIIGMAEVSDAQMLILKSGSLHALVGPNDPNVWDIKSVDPAIGLTSVRAINYIEGGIWWEAAQGLFKVEFGPNDPNAVAGAPVRADSPFISDRLENLNQSILNGTAAAYDSINQRLFFAVPESTSSSRNTILLPYNTKLRVFEDVWDPMDVSAMGVFSINGVRTAVIGGYQGRIFLVWQTPYVDGVRQTDGVSVTFTLAGTMTAATANTMTDSGATFDTANDGLREVTVFAVSPAGVVQRNTIASNTGTVLTLNNNWSITPDNTWKYYVGSPWYEFDTVHLEPSSGTEDGSGSAFYTRNFKRLLLRAASDAGATLDIYTIIDGDYSTFGSHSTFQVQTGGAKWDIDKWDVGRFGSSTVTSQHQSIGAKGHSCGIRVQSRLPGDSVTVLSLGLYGTEHNHKAK